MTEGEWLACEDSEPLLKFLRGKSSDRKMRLFSCRCSRRVWKYLTDSRSQQMIQIAERYADGQATEDELGDGIDNANEAIYDAVAPSRESGEIVEVAADAAMTVGKVWHWHAAQMVAWVAARDNASVSYDDGKRLEERFWQAHLIRCIFGNPFRPVAFDPQWLTSTVMQFAQGIYDDRAFDRMPILADALQDAGCDNDEVLNHCRDPKGVHARGCWVVDMVLGKE